MHFSAPTTALIVKEIGRQSRGNSHVPSWRKNASQINVIDRSPLIKQKAVRKARGRCFQRHCFLTHKKVPEHSKTFLERKKSCWHFYETLAQYAAEPFFSKACAKQRFDPQRRRGFERCVANFHVSGGGGGVRKCIVRMCDRERKNLRTLAAPQSDTARNPNWRRADQNAAAESGG